MNHFNFVKKSFNPPETRFQFSGFGTVVFQEILVQMFKFFCLRIKGALKNLHKVKKSIYYKPWR